MAVMGKTKRSLPENTALTAEQQDEFNEKVKNIKKNVSMYHQRITIIVSVMQQKQN